MPIHAAGRYGSDRPVSVSDLFISSYTPTLSALLEARKHPEPEELLVLPVAQPSPGKGFSRLPSVTEELELILKAVPPENLSHIPSSVEGYASVKGALSQLSKASIVHFACHGVQDSTDPLRSAFILADGERLTIEELMKHPLPHAHAAILSSCHSASNDSQRPDEALNLASAMLFIGFRSILATKWCVSHWWWDLI